MSSPSENLGFDPTALRAKYNEERDKRMRADGNAQYVHVEGRFAHFLDDPYTPRQARDPVVEDVDVVILGGGFGGLLAAVRLQEAGVSDVRIIERGGDFGGTWYWNRYPGAACDVESYIYLPLLEEIGYMPTEKYARAPEIAAHAQAIGKKYGLYPKTHFQTEITAFEWDDSRSRWRVKTHRDDKITARFVVICPGHYQNPKLPGIPGIETYRGHSFHTSRWDYAYTGGDVHGDLRKLQDKVVGVIGTGATAIQCVPHLGRGSRQLYVFQRTPSSVDVRGNRPTDPAWRKGLTPGWQKRRIDNFTALTSGIPVQEDLIDDSWTKPMLSAVRTIRPDMTDAERGELLQLNDFRIMENVRARVDAVVKDKATAEALKPWYNRLCKRPCFHDDYLETFNRPNVALVDTAGQGVERITANGVVAAGKEYKVDCIVYATGFELSAYTGITTPVYGRDGRSLAESWKEGAQTLHGIHSHGFPNLFILSTTQSAWGANFPHMMEEQARHAAYIIQQLKERGVKRAEAKPDAVAEWVATHEKYAAFMHGIWADCTPSYFNNEGHPSKILTRNGGFGGGVLMFVDILARWRSEGTLAGLELVK